MQARAKGLEYAKHDCHRAVTRIEGHAKITIQLADDGSVADARMSVAQFRGFEKFVVGRPFYEMPSLTARTCGICAVLSSFYYHYARLIEILYGIEQIERLLDDPAILRRDVRATGGVNNDEGIGMSEAPRGMLLHHYKVDENGLVTWANLIIASGHNNLAMNKGVLQVARHYVNGTKLTEGMLNRVEAVVRAFDPCLACSTHALGQMQMELTLMSPDGEVLDRLARF